MMRRVAGRTSYARRIQLREDFNLIQSTNSGPSSFPKSKEVSGTKMNSFPLYDATRFETLSPKKQCMISRKRICKGAVRALTLPLELRSGLNSFELGISLPVLIVLGHCKVRHEYKEILYPPKNCN